MEKRAIVLGGGGSRGAYQIGVWRALRELGIDYQIVTGASVGALNGVMMVQRDYDRAEQLWQKISTEDVVNLKIAPERIDYKKPGWEREVWKNFVQAAAANGGADFSPLEKTISQVVDEEKVRDSEVDFGLVTVEFPSMKPAELTIEQIPKGELAEFLLASSSCFPALKSRKIGDVRYVDGAYHDNMPVNLALSMGASEVIAVDLEGPGIVRRPKAGTVPVRYIRCYWNLGPFLWFEPSLSRKNMELGYLDTLRAYRKVEGTAYSFVSGTGEYLQKLLSTPGQRLLEIFRQWLKAEASGSIGRTLSRGTQLRCQRILRKHGGNLRSSEGFFMAVAEIAGELLKLEHTLLYSADEFHRHLTEDYAPVEKFTGQIVESFRQQKASVWELVEKVIHEGPLSAVSFCCSAILQAASEGDWPSWIWNLGIVVPESFLTAIYLCLLRMSSENG